MKDRLLLLVLMVAALSVAAVGFFAWIGRPSIEVVDDAPIRYSAGEDEPGVSIDLALVGEYDLNDLLGFPEGNTLKMHDVCWDDELQQGYAVGIMSPEIAVFDATGEVIGYIDTGIGEGDFSLKYITCDGGRAYVADENTLVRIDGEAMEVEASTRLREPLFVNEIYYDNVGYLLIPNPTDLTIEMFHSDLRVIESLPYDLSDIFYTAEGDLVVLEIGENAATFPVTILSGQSLLPLQEMTLDIGARVEDSAYDPDLNDLWVLTSDRVLVFDLDDPAARPDVVRVVPDPAEIDYGGGMVAVITHNGYDDEVSGGFRGGISIIEAETRKEVDRQELEHIHKSLDVDAAGEYVYVTSNNDNSVMRINMHDSSILEIDAGTSAEHGVVSADGDVFVANRLGGSTLVQLSSDGELVRDIDVENWPVGSAYSQGLDTVYAYTMLSGEVLAIDPASGEVVDRFDLGVGEAETDGIGHLSLDQTDLLLYVTIPEQNEVVVVDAKSGRVVEVIYVEDYLDDYTDLAGAGMLVTQPHEPSGRVFVYAHGAHSVYVYDRHLDYALVGTIEEITSQGIKDHAYALFVDQGRDVLYVGEQMYDVYSLEHLGELSYGNNVAAIDYERDFMMTADVDSDGQETLYVLTRAGAYVDQIRLFDDQYVKARFAYDQHLGVLWAFSMADAKVMKIELF